MSLLSSFSETSHNTSYEQLSWCHGNIENELLRSPDLNHIEHMWDSRENTVSAHLKKIYKKNEKLWIRGLFAITLRECQRNRCILNIEEEITDTLFVCCIFLNKTNRQKCVNPTINQITMWMKFDIVDGKRGLAINQFQCVILFYLFFLVY